VAFPILDPELRARILEDMELYLRDDLGAWLLGADGVYSRATPRAEGAISAQAALLEKYTAAAGLLNLGT
jgi:polyphosphate kinase